MNQSINRKKEEGRKKKERKKEGRKEGRKKGRKEGRRFYILNIQKLTKKGKKGEKE